MHAKYQLKFHSVVFSRTKHAQVFYSDDIHQSPARCLQLNQGYMLTAHADNGLSMQPALTSLKYAGTTNSLNNIQRKHERRFKYSPLSDDALEN